MREEIKRVGEETNKLLISENFINSASKNLFYDDIDKDGDARIYKLVNEEETKKASEFKMMEDNQKILSLESDILFKDKNYKLVKKEGDIEKQKKFKMMEEIDESNWKNDSKADGKEEYYMNKLRYRELTDKLNEEIEVSQENREYANESKEEMKIPSKEMVNSNDNIVTHEISTSLIMKDMADGFVMKSRELDEEIMIQTFLLKDKENKEKKEEAEAIFQNLYSDILSSPTYKSKDNNNVSESKEGSI